MEARIASFVARQWLVPEARLRVAAQPLCGGLESAVTRASLSAPVPAAVPSQLVVKELRGGLRREAAVYRALWNRLPQPPAAQILGVESEAAVEYLFLEYVRPTSDWPWADTTTAAEVCRELARLHAARDLLCAAFNWDYEADLAASAEATVATAREMRDASGVRFWRRPGDLKRVVDHLAELRQCLFDSGTAVIHGDVHPGNVIIGSDGRGPRVVLIDWGRARVGSPLEDVASWLHSLGCWEPQARRRHDTLLRVYLERRGRPAGIPTAVRREYWLASASNGLAGAIRYHLAVLGNPDSPERLRSDCRQALRAWERVIRRAATLIGTSSAD